jgi:hypothetical protein
MVFHGTTATTAESPANNIESDIISFSIANTTGGSLTARVGIFYGSTIVYILYDKAINSGDSYIYSGEPIRVLPNYKIFVSFSGSMDYYFTII